MIAEIMAKYNYGYPSYKCCESCKHFVREFVLRHLLEFCNHPSLQEYAPWDKEVSVECICDLFEGENLKKEGN